MIRWTFGFKEYPIHVTVAEENTAEDARIRSALDSGAEFLDVSGNDGVELRLNLKQVNLVMRQTVSAENPGVQPPSDLDKKQSPDLDRPATESGSDGF